VVDSRAALDPKVARLFYLIYGYAACFLEKPNFYLGWFFDNRSYMPSAGLFTGIPGRLSTWV
jgi:hypothetical protein